MNRKWTEFQCEQRTLLWCKIWIHLCYSLIHSVTCWLISLFSSGLWASHRRVPLLCAEQCVCGAQRVQGSGRVSQQKGRGEPQEPHPLPQLQGEPEGQVSQLASPLLRKQMMREITWPTSSRLHVRITDAQNCLYLHSFQTSKTLQSKEMLLNAHHFINKLKTWSFTLLKRETK